MINCDLRFSLSSGTARKTKTMAATDQDSRLRPGLKFFLFDVVVVVCIAVALLSASRDMDLLSKTGTYENGTAALCHVERDPGAEPVPCAVVDARGRGRGLRAAVVAWATKADERHIVLPVRRVLERTPPTPAPAVADAFPVGSAVEVSASIRGSSFPAIVTDVQEGGPGGNVTYFLTNAIWDFAMPGLDGRFVRPYRIYEDGTAAICNVERQPRVKMVPCTVVSHVGSGQYTTYKVLAQPTRGGEQREIMLSMRRVQRQTLKEPTADKVVAEASPEADEVVAEAASTVDEVVANATSTADKVVAEAAPTADKVVADAASTLDEVVAKADFTADVIVAETAPTRDEDVLWHP